MALYLSDDEDYYDYYDDYDDFDDSLVDQLAGSTSHDIVPVDDPSLETGEYFSDWDEQSDDYYDEEPTAVRRRRVLGNNTSIGNRSNVIPTGIPPEKRKQKLGNTSNIEKQSAKMDTSSFRAVVWKKPNHEDDNIVQLYEPGNGEKVALLKNWREVFKNAHPSNDRFWIRKRAFNSTGSDPVTHTVPVDRPSEYAKEKQIPSVAVEPVEEVTIASPIDYCNKQPSDVSDSATPSSDIPSTTQTQISSVTSDTSPDELPAPAVTVLPTKSRKRKASISVDTGPEHETTGGENRKPKSRKIASKGKAANNHRGQTRPPPSEVQRSTRVKKDFK